MPDKHPPRRKTKLWKKLLLVPASLVFCMLLLLAVEAAVRIILPDINGQTTDRELFAPSRFGSSIGWRPGATGQSFGAEVVIDEDGFRHLPKPRNSSADWLILGDSVAFGVGVEGEKTFPALMQQQLPTINIINSSVVSYNMHSYREVVHHYLNRKAPPDRILLFLCLNDIYSAQPVLPPPPTRWGQWSLSLAKRHCRTYILIKHLFMDRSRTWLEHDRGFYQSEKPEFKGMIKLLREIATASDNAGVPLALVILPYEYQLRSGTGKTTSPQSLLKTQTKDMKITVIDLLPQLQKQTEDSHELYLYSDAMHFSEKGHRMIAEVMLKMLRH